MLKKIATFGVAALLLSGLLPSSAAASQAARYPVICSSPSGQSKSYYDSSDTIDIWLWRIWYGPYTCLPGYRMPH